MKKLALGFILVAGTTVGLWLFLRPAASLRVKAILGNAEAQYRVGKAYENDGGTTHDYVMAAKWYRKAADQGHPWAQVNLGDLYESGKGVAKDYVEAIALYDKAAEQGDLTGQHNLGTMYNNGEGVPKSYEKAAMWYRKAADQGDPDSQQNLGKMYEYGTGVSKDYTKSAMWYQKAGEQGNVLAQYGLFRAYYVGQGVPKDVAEAAVWCRKAADLGYPDAQITLGEMYQNGQGVPQDLGEAYFWLDLGTSARQSGDFQINASRRHEEIADSLTKDQLTQLQDRIRRWHSIHPANPEFALETPGKATYYPFSPTGTSDSPSTGIPATTQEGEEIWPESRCIKAVNNFGSMSSQFKNDKIPPLDHHLVDANTLFAVVLHLRGCARAYRWGQNRYHYSLFEREVTWLQQIIAVKAVNYIRARSSLLQEFAQEVVQETGNDSINFDTTERFLKRHGISQSFLLEDQNQVHSLTGPQRVQPELLLGLR
jgi:TPR repeat protein